MSNFSIRLIENSDAAGVAGVLIAIGWFGALHGKSESEITELVLQHLNKATEAQTTYVAVNTDKQIVGYLNIHWHQDFFMPGVEGYISELFVSPNFQGNGIGTALLNQAESEARSRGATRLSLINNKTRDSYQKGFYEKAGWQERSQMANFVKEL